MPKRIQAQQVDVPFIGGVERRLRPELVPNGKLLTLQNYGLNKDGTPRRRDALTALSNAASVVEFAELNGGLFAVSQPAGAQPSLLGYNAGNSGQMVTYPGVPSPLSLRTQPIAFGTNQQQQLGIDCASVNGFTCFVWFDNIANMVKCSVWDESNLNFVVSQITVSASGTVGAPRVAVAGSSFVVFWNAAGTVNAKALVAGGTTLSSATAVASDLATNGVITNNGLFDACSVGSVAVVVYQASGSPIVAGSSVEAVAISAPANNAPPSVLSRIKAVDTGTLGQSAVGCLSCSTLSSTQLGSIAGNNASSNVYASLMNWDGSALSLTASGTQAVHSTPLYVTMAANAGATTFTCFVCGNPSSGAAVKMKTFVFSSSGVSGAADFLTTINATSSGNGAIQGPYIAGKAFTLNGVAHLPISIFSRLQNQILVVDAAKNVTARIAYGTVSQQMGPIVAQGAGQQYMPASVPTPSFAVLPFLQVGTLSFSSGTNTTPFGYSRATLTFGRDAAPTAPLWSAPPWHSSAAGALYFSGACPTMFDGAVVGEAGFHYFPEGITATVQAGAGLGTGSYSYCAVFEWVDGTGRRHQSAPSPVVTVATTAGNNQVALTCPTLQLGQRVAGTTIVFYRTLVDGTTFYRLTSVANAIANSTGNATVSPGSNDVQADSLIAGNEVLYTQPFEEPTTLPNDAPAGMQAIVSWQGRIVGGLAEDRHAFVVSQAEVSTVGLQWNEALVYRLPTTAGEITGFGVLDANLVIFTPSTKWTIYGAPPDPSGLNGAIGSPQMLPTDVGCIDQRSICNIPDTNSATGSISGGVGFQSRHGYYLLGRAMGDLYIGAPVEPDILGQTISAAVVLTDKPQLRLVVPSASPSYELVYDYLWGQWSKFLSGAIVRTTGAAWNGLWTISDKSGNKIYQESIGSFLDRGTDSIGGIIQTGWLEVSKSAGLQRVWEIILLGSFTQTGSDSVLTVSVDYDYLPNAGSPAAYSFTIGSVKSMMPIGSPIVELRHRPAQQKCQSIMLTISDNPTAASAGTNWTAMRLLFGVKNMGKTLPATQST